ncbi:MAG: class I SAM-dependent methyltransferase [Prolixibacteraceae bacterium]
MDKSNHFEINRLSWNIRTDIHIQSEFYNNEKFIQGGTSLNQIELDLLGDIKGKKILHLQCHFGQDTISLSRLGAEVTGIDLSDIGIERAKELAKKTGSNAKFICCNLYELPDHLEQKFDLIFTSYGTIVWLPDLTKWAAIVAQFIKPTGKFIFVEFHPFLWMYDDEFKGIKYNYFNTGKIYEIEEGSYTDSEDKVNLESVTWNHSLSEVMNSLIDQGLIIRSFHEYNYNPYNCFKNSFKVSEKKYRIHSFNDHVPMVYSVVAQNPKK